MAITDEKQWVTTVHEHCRQQLDRERSILTQRLSAPKIDSSAMGEVSDRMRIWMIRAKLRSVEQAQARLAAGQYGVCQTCRRPIEAERLLALPYAELCIDCQHRSEHEHGR